MATQKKQKHKDSQSTKPANKLKETTINQNPIPSLSETKIKRSFASLLLLTVFITGACVLIIEVAATRILAPYFGNTIYTVSSVLGVILGALSIGYYYGGRLADKKPSQKLFFLFIALSGIITLFSYALSDLVLITLVQSLNIATGPPIASFILFFVPGVLLGMLSPFGIRLLSDTIRKEEIGALSGKIYFFSTLGSIGGSLLSGFYLIPYFGIKQTMIGTSIVLIVLGILGFFLSKGGLRVVFFLLLFSSFSLLFAKNFTGLQNPSIIYSKDGIYEKLSVMDTPLYGKNARVLLMDRSFSSGIDKDSDELLFDYSKYYELYKFHNIEVDRALVLGAGTYNIPIALRKDLPDTTIEVVDIDPHLEYIAKEYFNLKDEYHIKSTFEDGRQYLRKSNSKYDLIFSDVYSTTYAIPDHFTTIEYFQTAKDHMDQEGIFLLNLIGDLSQQTPSLTFSLVRTFREVFPDSYFIAVVDPNNPSRIQNIIFAGFIQKIPEPNTDVSFHYLSTEKINENTISLERYDLSRYQVLTDDLSPVELLSARLLGQNNTESTGFKGTEAYSFIQKQVAMGPRFIGSEGHTKLVDYLYKEMELHAEEAVKQDFEIKDKEDIFHYSNIIGRFHSDNPKRIVIGTHFDTLSKSRNGTLWTNNNPVGGANNGASGTAVILELARVLSARQDSPLGIDLVFFDGEEGTTHTFPGDINWKPLGSTYFVEKLDSLYSQKPQGAIVLDLVCSKEAQFHFESNSLQFAKNQTSSFWSYGEKNASYLFNPTVKYQVVDDHTPLNQAGVPSFLVIDFLYKDLHSPKDTIENCSEETLQSIGETLVDYIYSLN